MKIGVYYNKFNDIAPILNCLYNNEYEIFQTHTIYKEGDCLWYLIPYENFDKFIDNLDLKIRFYDEIGHYLNDINIDKYDFCVSTNLEEPFMYSDSVTLDYLNKGNLLIAASDVNIQHDNIFKDYFLNFYYFYISQGYFFLNYPNLITKKNLCGVYFSESFYCSQRGHREQIYTQFKNILNDDFVDYNYSDFKQKNLIVPHSNMESPRFGFWTKNHISSYTDYIQSVCNLIFETKHFDEDKVFFSEKTLKSLLFSNQNIFFIWAGSHTLFKELIKKGFWFLNCEFYDGDIKESLIKSATYLKDLKLEFGDGDKVYEELLKKYKSNLQNNVKLTMDIIENYENSKILLDLIKNHKNK